jgi:hypothetical protein
LEPPSADIVIAVVVYRERFLRRENLPDFFPPAPSTPLFKSFHGQLAPKE